MKVYIFRKVKEVVERGEKKPTILWLRLAGEARAQDSGDFGITELLFGR